MYLGCFVSNAIETTISTFLNFLHLHESMTGNHNLIKDWNGSRIVIDRDCSNENSKFSTLELTMYVKNHSTPYFINNENLHCKYIM